MSTPSEDELARFRAESDRAYSEMKARADQEMARFLETYSDLNPVSSSSLTKAPPLQATPPSQKVAAVAPVPSIQPSAQSDQKELGRGALQEALAFRENLREQMGAGQMPKISPDHLADTREDLRKDFSQLSKQAKSDVHNTANEALQGTKEILKGAGADLGRRALDEAAALRDAARRAVQEERSLKALRGRAQEELSAAKDRFKSQATDAKNEAFAKFQEMASSTAEELKDAASGSFSAGFDSLEREAGDLFSGQDTPE